MSDPVEMEARQIAAREAEAFLRIARIERQTNLFSLVIASVSMGLGFDSFWVGLGTFCSLIFLATTLANAMTKHRYLTQESAGRMGRCCGMGADPDAGEH